MFDTGGTSTQPLTTRELASFTARLAALGTDVDDLERIDRIRHLEQFKSAAAAAQARMTVAFDSSQRAAQRAAGVPARRVGAGIAAQVALAKRESPARTERYTGWAKLLVDELPATFAALQRGDTTEWRAMIVARESICLPEPEQRAAIDADLGPRLHELGDRQVEAEAKKLAYRLDPEGFVDRRRAAERDRRVSVRPAPDTMARLSALLPAAQAVAAYAALAREAERLRAAGDERGRGQQMADTLVERVTGQAVAEAVPVEINLVMTDRSLFNTDTTGDPETTAAGQSADPANTATDASDDPFSADATDVRADDAGLDDHDTADADDAGADDSGEDEPAHLVGYGPIPAGLARALAGSTLATAWILRLYADPHTGRLTRFDTKRRRFGKAAREAIIVRDQVCRTPWCGAPIRHADHVIPVAEGGRTSLDNGQGLCEACNHAKQATGWTSHPGPGGAGESVIITTPTGHRYESRPPDLPGARPAQSTLRPGAGPAQPAASDHAA